ncbi:MAG: hypothetical protein QNJ98_11085 [Planctomycetota bacterium]|nr:hypothetical protein [Planctomycetota bacterium]
MVSPQAERGVLMVWAAFVMLLVAGLIVAGTQRQQALNRMTRVEHSVAGQARAVAVAGVVDAFAWFRRQTVQPVTAFTPALDLAATPPVNETDDPAIGLVREYEISPSLWGRYEVRLTKVAEPYTDANGNGYYDEGEAFTDQDGNGQWDGMRETRDVSLERGLAGSGGVWLIESHGFLYRRQDLATPLGVSPNDRLATFRVASEIRRLTLTPPAAAALCADQGSSVTIGNRSRITGGTGSGVAFASASGSPSMASGSEVTGSPATTAQPSYDTSLEAVFGVSLTELRSMADVSTTSVEAIGSPIGDMTLNVIDGNATFDASNPLRGTGIVVVLGNCTIESGSNSFFGGLLWVGGNLTVRAPSYLRGVVVAQGTVDVRGVGGDYAEMNYDDGIIGELLFLMGQYRHTKAVYVPDSES